MLVVGDQAPYEDAAVSWADLIKKKPSNLNDLVCVFCILVIVLLSVATRWSATAKWTQPQRHS